MRKRECVFIRVRRGKQTKMKNYGVVNEHNNKQTIAAYHKSTNHTYQIGFNAFDVAKINIASIHIQCHFTRRTGSGLRSQRNSSQPHILLKSN